MNPETRMHGGFKMLLYGANLMYVVEHALTVRERAELVMGNIRFVETLREGTDAVLQKYTHRDIVDRLQFTRSAWDDNGCTDVDVSQILQWHAITDYAITDIDSVISRLGGVSPLHYSYSYVKTLEKIVERLESICREEGARIQITSLPCRDRTITCVNVLGRVFRKRPLPTIAEVLDSIQADYTFARDTMKTVLLIARMQHRPSASGYVYLPNFNITGC